MTYGSMILIALAIAGFVTYDAITYDWELSVSLARRFAGLIEWFAFWR